MATDSSLPSYDSLFRDLDLHGVDDARSVFSPAAYLADLLQLLHDHFQDPDLVRRRPTIENVPLDAERTFTVLPYLDIVNEVLAAALGPDAFTTLTTLRHPAALPFALQHETLKELLGRLEVDAAELYALFASTVDPDTAARLRLGLSTDDVDALVTPTTATPADAETFRRANELSAAELATVLATAFVAGGTGPLDGAVRDRTVRFVRLARRVGLTFPELDLVLRSCCANRIDPAALRTIAALLAVGRGADLPIDVVCSLVAPLDTTGLDGTGTSPCLFDRVFNAAGLGAPVLVPSAPSATTNGRRVLVGTGDILAPRDAEYRRRVGLALGMSEGDLAAVVARFRARGARRPAGTRPFDHPDGNLADLSLLHRVSRLVTALDASVAELFDVLDVLDADPSFPASSSFPVPVAHEPAVDDCHRMLDAEDVGSSTCLVQTLFAVTGWMRRHGLTGAELAGIVGTTGRDDDQPTVAATLAAAFDEVALSPDVLRSDRFGERAAEVVHDILADGATTYLFSGDQYVRYSGTDHRFVDPGYPRLLAGNLRREVPFAALPEEFEDVIADRAAAGGPVIDAVVGNPRTVSVFVGTTCHVASRSATAAYDIGALGRVRNAVADRGRVDAALVTDAHTFLFSGDQYVRYSGAALDVVDDGYPRTLESALAGEPDLGLSALPEAFRDGLDAAFRGPDGATYLFAGAQYLRSGADPQPVAGAWGRVRNAFTADGGLVVDAAFVAPGGELYAFRGGQYVRYRPGETAVADDGHPRSIRDDWGTLPDDFEEGIDGAFVVEGRTYLCLGDRYVRYSGDYHEVDRTYPQPFRARWSDVGDYRLADVHTIARFAALAHAHPSADGGLGAFLATGPAAVADPYARLAELLGWDAGEIRWLQRRGGFLGGVDGNGDPDDRIDLELLLRMADAFALGARLDTGPSRIHDQVWAPLFGPAPDLPGAAAALEALLAQRTGPQEWPALAGRVHDALTVRVRDALVAAVLAQDPADALRSSRDLFDRFLIDVDMGPEGRTSRVREAIAAAQLYVHRYLLDLERPAARGDAEQVRADVRRWWEWMRSYRVWEANRKVFVHPENYLRPELRGVKTPAFAALESDLLQGEITPATVAQAYKHYLDEYTEVSGLTIAGGHVYADRDGDPGLRNLVLFGRTKADPRRYHYRRAVFRSGATLSTSWEPWLAVGVAIDADTVHPTHAFDRVFVFWAVVEAVPPHPAAGTVMTTGSDGTQRVAPTQTRNRIAIYYSFYNLTGGWVPPQQLGTSGPQSGTLSEVTLSVRAPEQPAGPPGEDQGSILVSCSWVVTTPDATGPAKVSSARAAFALFPQLYSVPVPAVEVPLPDVDSAVGALFGDGEQIGRGQVVRFSNPTTTAEMHWFSVDHKGGSFLCRPVLDVVAETPLTPLRGNTDKLPQWSRIDAAFELGNGTRYFFDNGARSYLEVASGATPGGATTRTATRWGRRPRPTPDPSVGRPDGLVVRDGQAFVVVGSRYLRYRTGQFDRPDTGYPRDLADNPDGLPRWDRLDAGVRTPDGGEWYFTRRPRPQSPGQAQKAPAPVQVVQPRGPIQLPSTPFPLTPFPTDIGTNPLFHAQEPPPAAASASGPAAPTGPAAQGPVVGMYARGAQQEPQELPPAWGLRDPVDAAVVDPATGRTFLFAGFQYVRFTGALDRPDAGYPRPLGGNPDGLPGLPSVRAAFMIDRSVLLMGPDGRWAFADWGDTTLRLRPDGTREDYDVVDAAWIRDGRLYLAVGRSGDTNRARTLLRYTLADGVPGEFVDDGYAVALTRTPEAAFERDGDLYLLDRDGFARVAEGSDPGATTAYTPYGRAWADLPATVTGGLTGSLDGATQLFLFVGDRYARHRKGVLAPTPFVLATMPREIIRLTSGTAALLNQRLLAGGMPALLAPAAQEIDETPRFRVDTDGDIPAGDATVTLRATKVDATTLPASSHLDFESANGPYYWEIFFHAPLLIAQALNEAQRFEEARRWYEYVFDPTDPARYWRFLPFLALDVDALLGELTAAWSDADALWPRNRTLGPLVKPVAEALALVAPAFRLLGPLDADQKEALDLLSSSQASAQLAVQERRATDPALARALHRLQEAAGVVTGLGRQYARRGDHDRLLAALRDDPFDPHPIAELRPVAYRRAVVMAYIDNLLDWGDMLFRQHTAETVDEARMLYVLALDLLGAPPEQLATALPAPSQSFASLDAADEGPLDLLAQFLTGGGLLTVGAGAVHRSVASDYFRIPANTVFDGYRERVEDRLRKIRASLDILGVAAPLALFDPPLDPMALVQAAAAGGGAAALTASTAAPVPHYRFASVFRKAQELTDKLRQAGTDLLGVLERRDAEELGLLQSRQEGVILGLTRGVKEAEVRIAAERLAELQAARTATTDRIGWITTAITNGASAKQREQIAMMTRGRDAHYTSAGLKIGAAIAKAAPQIKAGPFILGIEIGGDEIGGALETAAEVGEAFGEAFSMAGEVLGVQAEIERTEEDNRQQLAAARNDLAQLEHQLTGAQQQLAVAERELQIAGQAIADQQAVATFMRNKFGSAELYRWMAGQLAGLYFDAYHLAYEMARSAERAFRFERGVPDSEPAHVRPTYWDSRRGGLLAGESLARDLERLGAAAFADDARGLEITKRVSLRDLDPVAFLRLRDTGTCEFALTEALLDRDFPGHYRRQVRTVAVGFTDAGGDVVDVTATLAQLGHKTVLAPDPKAVKFLLSAQGTPPDTVRSDWRPHQQIALSHVDDPAQGNGLHELRFDDERYLPFEGTGAVSTWRLRLTGRAADRAGLDDVVVVLRYTADDGGEVFAAAVRGMLKPYAAARFVDVAAEFPDEWAQFHDGGQDELVLPFTTEMFPGITGRDVTGVYPSYDLAGGHTARLVLDGAQPVTLSPGRLAPTPGLRVGTDGAPGWAFSVDGDREALRNVGLVLTYKAGTA